MKYYINSNNGDYIVYTDDSNIILVTDEGYRNIPIEEFNSLKGFVPIKEKKMQLLIGDGLRGIRKSQRNNWNKYKPTPKQTKLF